MHYVNCMLNPEAARIFNVVETQYPSVWVRSNMRWSNVSAGMSLDKFMKRYGKVAKKQ